MALIFPNGFEKGKKKEWMNRNLRTNHLTHNQSQFVAQMQQASCDAIIEHTIVPGWFVPWAKKKKSLSLCDMRLKYAPSHRIRSPADSKVPFFSSQAWITLARSPQFWKSKRVFIRRVETLQMNYISVVEWSMNLIDLGAVNWKCI